MESHQNEQMTMSDVNRPPIPSPADATQLLVHVKDQIEKLGTHLKSAVKEQHDTLSQLCSTQQMILNKLNLLPTSDDGALSQMKTNTNNVFLQHPHPNQAPNSTNVFTRKRRKTEAKKLDIKNTIRAHEPFKTFSQEIRELSIGKGKNTIRKDLIADHWAKRANELKLNEFLQKLASEAPAEGDFEEQYFYVCNCVREILNKVVNNSRGKTTAGIRNKKNAKKDGGNILAQIIARPVIYTANTT